jgi:Tfp pilus assembly protein PilN
MVFEINLLPEKYRKKRISIKLDAKTGAIAGAVVVVALLVLVTVNQGRKLAVLEQQVTEMENEKAVLEPQANRVTNLQREMQDLNTKIGTISALGGRNAIQIQILEILNRELPDNVWYLDVNQEPPQQQRAGAQRAAADRYLNVRGASLRMEGVTELIARLRRAPIFQTIDTSYIRPLRVQGSDIFEFALVLTLNIAG